MNTLEGGLVFPFPVAPEPGKVIEVAPGIPGHVFHSPFDSIM